MKVEEVHAAGIAKLAALGATRDDVVAALRRLVCTGMPTEPFACPLAHYLDEQVPVEGHKWLIHGEHLELRDTWGLYGPDCPLQPVPAPCREFMDAFDNGEYDDLVSVPDESEFDSDPVDE